MATPVILPKQGNTVESSLITAWKVAVGDTVRKGDPLCEVETDKALFAVESPADGQVLAIFFDEGDDVPVMTHIAVIGEQGEDVEPFRPDTPIPTTEVSVPVPTTPALQSSVPPATASGEAQFISPRARQLADRHGIDYRSLVATGPEGRIIERDVQAALAVTAPRTRGASGLPSPSIEQGTGIGGRVTRKDIASAPTGAAAQEEIPADFETIPVRGIRRLIADRMHTSLQSTAQLTMFSSADARSLRVYRARLKTDDDLRQVTLNDMLMYAVARTLLHFPDVNATFDGSAVTQYRVVHLGMAVDSPRGLVVPVIRHAHMLSLAELSSVTKRLALAAIEGTIHPDELQGGTFTVTNLGGMGIEAFTPIINPPQVAILGVGAISPKPVEVDETIEFIPHIALSLTIDHQVVDGAPGARFLAALRESIADFDLLLARG